MRANAFSQVFISLGKVTILIKQIFHWFTRTRFSWVDTINQMIEVGVKSLPVTALTSLFTGMVLALQSGYATRNIFNEPIYIGTVVALSLIKELGPVLTAVVVVGRVGAAFTAEIGTMKVTEQIDALYTLGTNPVKYLVIPRLLACLVMMPILAVFSDFIGIFGGYFISVTKLAITPGQYWNDIFDFLVVKDFLHGLIKSLFFAGIIALVSCYKGLECSGGAQGVGKSTTSAVVTSIVLILVSDYFLSNLLMAVGL
ncbi:MAG TPA: ABC transporter permease [Elusimicrobia bacterium]|jgi:phospholipid/cholesterol/gamma-HCH transport system permease protein|nr:ABC transporter permease [Elusimicrobiota bacterium]